MDATTHVMATEFGWIERSLQMADSAFDLVSSEAAETMEVRRGNVMLGASRMYQNAAKDRIRGRLDALKIAAGEAKLIDQVKKTQGQISGKPAA